MIESQEDSAWSAQLLAAEAGAERVSPKPISLADLESRGRRQRAAQGAWAAAALLGAFLGWTQGPWSKSGIEPPIPPLGPVAQQAIENLHGSIQALTKPQRSPEEQLVAQAQRRADEVIERSLTNQFRANYRLAEAGDVTAWVHLQRLSRRYPDSHGGRSARAYLASLATPDQER